MRKSLVAFLIWSLLLGSRLSLSLEKTEDASPVDTQIRAAEKLLYNNVIITLRNGGLVAGALAGIDNEGVIILKKGQEEKIPRGAIQQITIDIEKNRTWPIFLGFSGGAYLGSLIFLRAKGQPPEYMKDNAGKFCRPEIPCAAEKS
jgi:small nuclear ribonucleoprotein (snRNP)-like protein